MGRSPRRPGLARAAAVALATALLLPPAPAAAAGWGRPFRLVQPVSLDVADTAITFAPTGASALSYTVQNADNPTTAKAFTAGLATNGRISAPRQVRGVQQVLDLAYDGSSLELLAGTSERGLECCSTAEALRATHGRYGAPRKLVEGLAGPTLGRLVALPDRLLAAVATERGVWVSQSSATDRFQAAHRLTPASALPEALDATSFSRTRTAIVWTARPNPLVPAPTQIFVSTGSQKSPPRKAGLAFTVPSDHRIDELAVAQGPSWPTVAWIENWFDSAGAYHSQAFEIDLRARPRPLPLSSPTELAAGLGFAADARGDQAISWKGCTALGDCAVRAVLRPARGRFTQAVQLPAVDGSQTPAVAVSPQGLALLAWVQQGHIIATDAPRGAHAFGQPRLVSATSYGADLTLAFGPKNHALAAWTQGTLNQSVVGASFTNH